MAGKKMTADQEAALLESLSVLSSADELADADNDTDEVKRVKAILRGDVNPHAREWGDNWTHLNINDKDGNVLFVHPKNRAAGDTTKNGKGSIAPNAVLKQSKDGSFAVDEEATAAADAAAADSTPTVKTATVKAS